MGNMIPQKSFDAQMHIIRDVHFDVDKYKIDELYVIKHATNNAHTVDGKMVGKLIEADAKALTFDIFVKVSPEGVLPRDPHNYYGITTITLLLDDIIERQIEIERLLTETEAAVYLMSSISKECAKDIIPEPINRKPVLADKYKGDLSHFIMPNSLACGEKYLYTDGTLKYVGMGEEHPSIDKAAYKNGDAFDRFMRSEPITLKAEPEPAVDTNVNRLNYVCCIPATKRGVSFIKEDGSFAYELFDRFKEGIKVNLKCGETIISFRTSPKNITADGDTISMRNGNGTIKIVLHKDSFYKVFDIIRFTS